MDSLLWKGKTGCFPNWHEIQSKLSLDTGPNKPLETSCCTQEDDDARAENAKVIRGEDEVAAETPLAGRWDWKSQTDAQFYGRSKVPISS